jgi:hypothetical protein
MQLIDNHAAGILAGYDRIRQAEALLPARWRERLLRVYAGQRQMYERAAAKYREQSVAVNRVALVGAALLALAASAGWVLLLVGSDLPAVVEALSWVLGVGGAVGLVGLGLVWGGRAILLRPKLPAHPPAIHTEALLPLWRQALTGTLPAEPPDAGAAGEFALIRLLQRLDSPGYILWRAQQERGDDLDVTLIWPGGVWLFEVKNWTGWITWRDGAWERIGQDGRSLAMSQPPDEQWKRMVQDVSETLHRHAPQLLERQPALADPCGGLVFTNERAYYDIAPAPTFAWGTPSAWAQHLGSVPPIAGLDERDLLWVLDTLLTRHREVCDERGSRSLDLHAAHLIEEAEAELSAEVRQWEALPQSGRRSAG